MMAAQITHAAGESVTEKLPPQTHAVVLAVPNELELRRIADKLEKTGIIHKLIIESDSPYSDQAMAIGIAPMGNRQPLIKTLSSLPLLRDPVKRGGGSASNGAAEVLGAIPDSRTIASIAQPGEHPE